MGCFTRMGAPREQGSFQCCIHVLSLMEKKKLLQTWWIKQHEFIRVWFRRSEVQRESHEVNTEPWAGLPSVLEAGGGIPFFVSSSF